MEEKPSFFSRLFSSRRNITAMVVGLVAIAGVSSWLAIAKPFMSAHVVISIPIKSNVSKTVFEPGEKIGFWYTHTKSYSSMINLIPTSRYIVDSSGKTVYTFPVARYTATLPYPTTPRTFPLSWDQRLSNGTNALEGRYTLITKSPASNTYSPVSFSIVVRTVKFNPGAPVNFSMKNTYTAPITVTGENISILDWEGNKVYTYPTTSSFTFKPNFPTILTWDQKYTDGTTAPWSSYTVSIYGSAGSLVKSTPKIANIYGTYPSEAGDQSGEIGDDIMFAMDQSFKQYIKDSGNGSTEAGIKALIGNTTVSKQMPKGVVNKIADMAIKRVQASMRDCQIYEMNRARTDYIIESGDLNLNSRPCVKNISVNGTWSGNFKSLVYNNDKAGGADIYINRQIVYYPYFSFSGSVTTGTYDRSRTTSSQILGITLYSCPIKSSVVTLNKSNRLLNDPKSSLGPYKTLDSPHGWQDECAFASKPYVLSIDNPYVDVQHTCCKPKPSGTPAQ